MVNITGSGNTGGTNQSGVNDFDDSKFWFEWIEIDTTNGTPSNLTDAGFDTSNGDLDGSEIVYNAGGTDDLDGLTLLNEIYGDDNVSGGGSGNNNDGNDFAIRVTTTLEVTAGGTYTFDVRSDDGMILYVDGEPVVVDDSLHGPRTTSDTVDLTPGQHEIVIIYFERGGQNVLEVDIAGPDYTGTIPLQDANVQANAADDIINSFAGDDNIVAGAGADIVNAGDGNDIIDGGDGNDILTGGDGFDTFIVSSGNDTITDFNTATGQDIEDGDQTNNDFLDLNPYYVNLAQAKADLADDGIMNQSDGSDYTSVAALPGTITLTGVVPDDLTEDNINVACFTPGILIETAHGLQKIETLQIGDMVKTKDTGFQPIRWIGHTTVRGHGHLAPVKITKGAINNTADIWVSPQHRFLCSDWRAQLLFGMDEVLVSAKALINDHSIISDPTDAVTYIHMLFDHHNIVYAAGIETESFHPGETVINGIGEHQRAEILELFPELENIHPNTYPACRPILKMYEGVLLKDSI